MCFSGRTYPVSKPRKALPQKHTAMLIVSDDEDRVLLHKRPPAGIWGGLWSLPECPPDTDMADWCGANLGLQVDNLHQGPPLKHTFSHFQLTIQPVYIRIGGHVGTGEFPSETLNIMEETQSVWYNTRHPDARGLPAPVKNLLDALNTKLGNTAEVIE